LTAQSATGGWAALRRASANGLAINLIAQFLRLFMQLAYQVCLARLLVPQDFGLVAMASPILAFVSLLADFGLTQATIQRPSMTQAELSFIFWANCLLGAALSLATIASAPLVAQFYGASEAGAVTAALGALFLLNGLYSQHVALLNRRLAFGRLAALDLISFGVGTFAGILAAAMGMRFWAIVIGQATVSLVSLPLAWIFAQWRPSPPRRVPEAGKLLVFGADMTTFNFMNYFARNLDNILIGRFLGDAALGLYDRAYKLLLLPLTQVTVPFAKVALPLLSRTRGDPERYRQAYLRMLEIIMALTFPGVVFAVSTSHQLIVTVLGDRWADVAPIFGVLGLGALFAPIGYSTGWLFVTQGRTREMRNWGMFSSALYVASFAIGLPWGPLGVAICYTAVGVLQAPFLWRLATRVGPVELRHLISAIFPCALGAAVAGLVDRGLESILAPGPPALLLLLVSAYAMFAATLACLPHGRRIIRDSVLEGRRLADWLALAR
jgi:polysaccharide transporter, PST family